MSYITNQWLKGGAKRRKGHHPIPVSTSAMKSEDKWSKRRKVVVEIRSAHKNKDYLSVYITKKDLANILPVLFEIADKRLQNQILYSTIERQDETETVRK